MGPVRAKVSRLDFELCKNRKSQNTSVEYEQKITALTPPALRTTLLTPPARIFFKNFGFNKNKFKKSGLPNSGNSLSYCADNLLYISLDISFSNTSL